MYNLTTESITTKTSTYVRINCKATFAQWGNATDIEVFVYKRAREGRDPLDVVHVLVDSSVTLIPNSAF